MALPTYSTGTASVAAGGTVVTGAGCSWTGINVKQGDFISIGGSDAALITEVTDITHLKVAPWTAGAKTTQPYIIYQNYVGRVVGVAAAEDVGVMLEKLHTDGLPFIVDPALTVPDPSYGDDGQMAFKPSTGQWWTKTGGVWVSSPGLTSDSSKVLKSGDTMTGSLVMNAAAFSALIQLRNSANGNSKYIRMGAAADMEITNSANSAVIMTLTDAGELSWTGTVWTAYTPSATLTGGTATATGRYKRYGKMVAIQASINITASGNNLICGLPVQVVAGPSFYLTGREGSSTGNTYVAQVPSSSTTMNIMKYDNSFAFTSGWNIILSGIYEGI